MLRFSCAVYAPPGTRDTRLSGHPAHPTLAQRLAPTPCLPPPPQTLSGCGDAVRLEMAVGAAPGADSSTVLDNTIWFHSITASRIGGRLG